MKPPIGHLETLDYRQLTNGINDEWKNFVVSEINDHVVRLSVLQRDFHWHSHSQSDELFYVIEGKLYVDLEDRNEEILAGQMITIPKNVRHRTRSKERTIILCFETKDNDVVGELISQGEEDIKKGETKTQEHVFKNIENLLAKQGK